MDTSSDFPFSNSNYTFPRPLITVEVPLPIYEEPSSSIISAPNSSFRKKIWCEDPIHQLSEMLANRAIVVTNTTFSWSSWVFPLPFFYGHSKLKWPFGPTLFLFQVLLHSLCAYSSFVLKHIILRSISLFWLLFKSLFSFCLKKMVRSIIVKGGVSRERVVVKDSNDWSRLPGHWSRSVIFTFTATHSLIIFSILSKCWDTLVPSCILLGKNRCRRHWMFTIVTESYILCRVSHLSHADSMSPKETSTLSLTTISSFEELFFYCPKL